MPACPPGFPLDPRDRDGTPVGVGDRVTILEIPDWLVHDLPAHEAASIRACAGQSMEVGEIDRYGYLWMKQVLMDTSVAYLAQSFAIEPANVRRL